MSRHLHRKCGLLVGTVGGRRISEERSAARQLLSWEPHLRALCGEYTQISRRKSICFGVGSHVTSRTSL
jgi:hypothetical protein